MLTKEARQEVKVAVTVEKEADNPIALRTLSHRIEANQLLWLYLFPGQNTIDAYLSGDPEDPRFIDFPYSSVMVFVETEDPKSHFYATNVSNAGLLDRKAYPSKAYKGVVKQINTERGVNYEFVDTLVHDARGIEVTIKYGGYTDPLVFSIKENDLPALDSIYNTESSDYEKVNFTSLDKWEPAYATSSQTRVGEMVAKRSDISYADYFKRIGFDIRAFEKEKNGRIHIKSVDKMSKRVKQTASSSKPRQFFKGFELEEIKEVPFENMDKIINAEHLLFKKGKHEAEILILPGFFVKQKVESILPSFHNNKIDMVKEEVEVIRDAMDGSHMVDRSFAIRHGMADENGELRSGEQFRWGQAIKGLMVVVPGLRRMLGVDMVLADGGIKGSPIQGFKDGDMDFAVLNRVRLDEVNPNLNLSRQVTSYNQHPELIKGLEKDTEELINQVLSFNEESIRDFLNIQDYDVESEEEVNVDQLTTRLYSTGKNIFMKSNTMKKKLSDLLRSSLQQFSNGAALLLKEASYKHMVVDPYAIIYYLRQGILGLDKETLSDIDKVGVAPGHVVVSERVLVDGEEKLQLNTRKGYAFRFPFLHEHEGRILNEDDVVFIDLDTKEFYEQYVEQGHSQGLIFYSLWDMEAESQGGADFDGDYTGYTNNPYIINYIEKQPSFLDYSLVDGELASGCPFIGNSRNLNIFLTDSEKAFMEAHAIQIEGDGISAPAELSNTEEWINIVGKLGAYLARHTLEGNDIGRFTNISLTVCQILTELDNRISEYEKIEGLETATDSLLKEKLGYERLNYFLAIAIRWEVDKAKHGGAYFDKMPFLYVFTEQKELQDIVEYEEQFNISLQRLIYGSKLR